MASAETAIDGPGLAVNIASLVASQKQHHPRNLVSYSRPLQRIQLPKLLLRASCARRVERRGRHPGLDEARADAVDADARSRELVGHRLRERHDGGLGGGVGARAGVGSQPGHGRRGAASLVV